MENRLHSMFQYCTGYHAHKTPSLRIFPFLGSYYSELIGRFVNKADEESKVLFLKHF